MNCIIDGFDFWNMEAMKYFAPSTSWSAEKKKDNAMQKIFSGQWYGAVKKDGCFYLCGKSMEGDIFVRPRAKNTKGEFVNKVDWVPQIHPFLNGLEPGTVILGELYLPRDEQAKSTSSLMNSLQTRAIKKQEKPEDKLVLYVFDILADAGESFLNMKAIDRFLCLANYEKRYNCLYVEWAEYHNGKELWNILQDTLANGGEGIVITYEEAKYEPGKRSNKVSLKVKRELQETIDCVIMGANAPTKLSGTKEPETWQWWFNETTGEKILASEYFAITHESIYKLYNEGATVVPVTKAWFYGWAGSLKLGLYDGDNLVHVGDLSGVDESMKENWKQWVGKVVEIGAMEITTNQNGGWGFRHPRMLRIRDDKPARECTIEQVR